MSGSEIKKSRRDKLVLGMVRLAVEQGDPIRLKRALEQGADPFAVDHFGRSPWLDAVRSKKESLVDLMIATFDAQRWIMAKDAKGCAALHHAADVDWVQGIRRFALAGADVNAKDLKGLTPLMHAAKADCAEAAEALLDAGADARIKAFQVDETALMLAAGVEKSKVLPVLVGSGVDCEPNAFAKDLSCALFLAIRAGCMDNVRELLKICDPLRKEPGSKESEGYAVGRNALMVAAARGKADIVELLASPEAAREVTDFGETALMMACCNWEVEDCMRMVQALAPISDMHAVDEMGRTAAVIARAEGRDEAGEWLDAYVEAQALRTELRGAGGGGLPSMRPKRV